MSLARAVRADWVTLSLEMPDGTLHTIAGNVLAVSEEYDGRSHRAHVEMTVENTTSVKPPPPKEPTIQECLDEAQLVADALRLAQKFLDIRAAGKKGRVAKVTVQQLRRFLNGG